MNQHDPLVSILMTAYNREKLIVEAIESVLKSSYKNFELIVVDDCSTDNTMQVAEQYAKVDGRIRVYQNEKNLGDYPNRNQAAKYANGEYLTYLDSDDTMLVNGLVNCMEGMLQFPHAGIGMYWLYTKGISFCENSQTVITNHFFDKQSLIIGPGGTILKKSFFVEINGYPEKYGPANDMYFNLMAASKTDVVFFPFEFIFYRLHDNQENKNYYSYLYNNYLYLKDALAELNLPLSTKQKKIVGNKNKRRFLMNLLSFFFKTRNLKKVSELINITEFKGTDVLKAIFN